MSPRASSSLQSLTLAVFVSLAHLVSASSNTISDLDKLSEAILGARAATETKPPISPVDLKYQNNNLAILPAQICGIVGAYFVAVVVLGICLLTFGRRMRRAAQYGSGEVEVEMTKAPSRNFEPTPISPASTTRSWMKKTFHREKKVSMGTAGNISAPVSPGMPGHHSFDQRVMASNREQQQRDLELLYQAVMDQDAKKASTTNVTTTAVEEDDITGQPEQPFSPISPQFPASPLSPPPQELPPMEFQKQGKPVDKRLLHIHTGRQTGVSSDMKSPLSPHSPAGAMSPVKAIYPPNSPASYGPQSPRGQGLPASPRSYVSRSSRGESMVSAAPTANTGKAESKTRKALRNLRISSPIHNGDEEERVPLSPRYYGEPGPAPVPPTPHTGKSFNSVTSTRTFITQDSDDEEEYNRMQREALDQPAPLPRPAPQRGNTHPSNLDLRSQASNRSLNASDGSLPFRNLHPDQAVPPTPVKTTVLDRKAQAAMRGPRTGGLTPMTGTVPMTPYSPYMPYTPITPVTPHLMNKREMKVRKKEEKRRVMAKDEGDLVEDDKSMWGDAY